MILTPTMIADSILAPACWPDWRDASAYGYLSHNHPDKWAWEYLRRNQDYIDAFTAFVPVWQECWGKGEYPISNTLFSPALIELSNQICQRFHLSPHGGPRNPNALVEPMFADEYVPHVEVLASWHDGKKLDHQIGPPASGHCVDVRIVAGRPLGEQIERIKAIYANLTVGLKRPTAQRPQPSKNILYLRCYDAQAAGAENRQIAETLYPSEGGDTTSIERVKKHIRKAKALVNGGYVTFVRRRWP